VRWEYILRQPFDFAQDRSQDEWKRKLRMSGERD